MKPCTVDDIDLVMNDSLKNERGSSLAVQWLGLCAFTAEGSDSIPGQRTKINLSSVAKNKKNKRVSLQTTISCLLGVADWLV